MLLATGTYSTHVWRFRRDDAKTGTVLLEHVGPDATVEFTEAGPPRVLPGVRHDVVPRDERPTPPEWGSYRQRGVAQGVPIMVRRTWKDSWVRATEALREAAVRLRYSAGWLGTWH